MTEYTKEDTTVQEFGTEVGCVIRFFNRKGYGFIKNLNDDKDYFVHNSEIKCEEGLYRKLYPGEYVSFNLIEKDGKQVCSLVKGVMGYPLLVENEEHTFRVYPKQGLREWSKPSDSVVDDDSDDDSDADNNDEDDDDSVIDDQTKETEFINKEAPEGIEVAAFDGLNCNEEMG